MGHFIFSLIGLKRILFTNIFQRPPSLRVCNVRVLSPGVQVQMLVAEAGGLGKVPILNLCVSPFCP